MTVCTECIVTSEEDVSKRIRNDHQFYLVISLLFNMLIVKSAGLHIGKRTCA